MLRDGDRRLRGGDLRPRARADRAPARAGRGRGSPYRPGPEALVHAQDKAVMRARLAELGVPCPRHAVVGSVDDVVDFGFPCVLKTTRGGYDGKGVWLVRSADECAGAARGRAAARRRAAGRGVRRVPPRAVRAGGPLAERPGGGVPVVATLQVDGICREVVAPAPDLDPPLAGAGPAAGAADRRRARRHRHPGGRAVRDRRRPGAGQRAGHAAAQHRALDARTVRRPRSSRTTCGR